MHGLEHATREELEQDIEILRVLIDTALDHRHFAAAEACAAVLADRRARLARLDAEHAQD